LARALAVARSVLNFERLGEHSCRRPRLPRPGQRLLGWHTLPLAPEMPLHSVPVRQSLCALHFFMQIVWPPKSEVASHTLSLGQGPWTPAGPQLTTVQ
jgi:hypothetical protein